MSTPDAPGYLTPDAQATDPPSLERHFGGGDGLLPLWIAEPYIETAPAIGAALDDRAARGWYGYETRPSELAEAFWTWMEQRHEWTGAGLATMVSPSVGTSIGALVSLMTERADGVVLQPPVFTDFKPIVVRAERTVVRNSLLLTDDGYRMDFADLEAKAGDPSTTAMILCNPHNPVGRVWTAEELQAVAEICARHDVFVIADEIHADLLLPPHRFVPFATIAPGTGVRWAALHGPIKTFGLAGVCDTLMISDDEVVEEGFQDLSSRLHLTRNNVFALTAFRAAYEAGGPWVDELLELVATNAELLTAQLPDPVRLIELQGTYLAWLDFRDLGLDVPELASWLAAEARLGLSPGHWFGREGAGFARMTIAAPTELIEQAIERLGQALSAV